MQITEEEVTLSRAKTNAAQESAVRAMVQQHRAEDITFAAQHGLRVTAPMLSAACEQGDAEVTAALVGSAQVVQWEKKLQLTPAFLAAVGAALEGSSSVRALCIAGGDADEASVAGLFKAISTMQVGSLQALNVPGSVKKAQTIQALEANLRAHVSSLRSLRFNGISVTNQGLAPMLATLGLYEALQVLDLGNTSIAKEAVAALSPNIPPSLEVLILDSCDKVLRGAVRCAPRYRNCTRCHLSRTSACAQLCD